MKPNNKGFTLIEVLAVLVVMGIIAAIAVPTISRSTERAEAEVCHANIRDI